MSDQMSPVDQSGGHVARAESSVDKRARKSLFAGSSVLGAVAMSSCCIIPLAMFGLGVTGAWIGSLASLYQYKWIIFLVTAGFLVSGFYSVYRMPSSRECTPGIYCATSLSDRISKTVLWAATILAVAALVFPDVAPTLLES